MLSGNGRHRRPRQAPALVVAAGVTGSAIAIPLLGATGAHAAEVTTWDRLADCESGGSWSADDGNGYYGGLQFSQEMWEQYGGLDYASRADQASRSQQIAVAEKVLADVGPSAWTTCAPLVGLTQGGAAAKVDTGVPDGDPSASADEDGGDLTEPLGMSPDASGSSDRTDKSSSAGKSSDSSDSSDSSESSKTSDSSDSSSTGTDGAGEKSHDATTKSDKSGVDEGTSKDTSDDPGAGSGRHRGDAAQEDPAGTRADDSAGRHASRGDASRGADGGAYTVREGDSLWTIADAHDVEGGWSALYADNKKTVGSDPDLIIPGQSLDLGLGGDKGDKGADGDATQDETSDK
ncbi:transglycosylase family protein [Streptomyces sp. NPDC002004]